MAAAMLLAGSLVSEDVKAANSWQVSPLTCSDAMRISANNATCIDVWHDNSPPASSRAGEGSTYGAQSSCSDYGTVKVHIDLIDYQNQYFILTDSEAINGNNSYADIQKLTCCLSASDLCYENQVEARSDGTIRSIAIDGETVTESFVDVSTHQLRFDFCRENPNEIYCTVDPSGDAHTVPPQPSAECDGEPCTVQDCLDNFDDSPAAGSPSSCTDLVVHTPQWNNPGTAPPSDISDYPLNDNNCGIRSATCTDSDGDDTETSFDSGNRSADPNVNIHDMVDIRYCESGETNSSAATAHKRLVFGACRDSTATD